MYEDNSQLLQERQPKRVQTFNAYKKFAEPNLSFNEFSSKLEDPAYAKQVYSVLSDDGNIAVDEPKFLEGIGSENWALDEFAQENKFAGKETVEEVRGIKAKAEELYPSKAVGQGFGTPIWNPYEAQAQGIAQHQTDKKRDEYISSETARVWNRENQKQYNKSVIDVAKIIPEDAGAEEITNLLEEFNGTNLRLKRRLEGLNDGTQRPKDEAEYTAQVLSNAYVGIDNNLKSIEQKVGADTIEDWKNTMNTVSSAQKQMQEAYDAGDMETVKKLQESQLYKESLAKLEVYNENEDLQTYREQYNFNIQVSRAFVDLDKIDPNYRKEQEEQRKRQQEVNAWHVAMDYIPSPAGIPVGQTLKAGNVAYKEVLLGLAEIPKDIASGLELGEALTMKDKGWAYELSRWTQETINNAELMTLPDNAKRGVFENVAKIDLDGQQYEAVVNNGQVSAVYGKNGMLVSDEKFKQVSELYDPEKNETSMQLNGMSMWGQGVKMGVDLAVLMAGTKGMDSMLKAGKLAKLGQGYAEVIAPRLAMFGTMTAQIQGDYFNEAYNAGFSRKDASKFALGASVAVAAVNQFNPQFYLMGKSKNAVAGMMPDMFKRYQQGVSVDKLVALSLKRLFIESNKEGFEEVMELPAENFMRNWINSGSDYRTQLQLQNQATDYSTSYTMGAALGTVSGTGALESRSRISKEALYSLYQDQAGTKEYIQKTFGEDAERIQSHMDKVFNSTKLISDVQNLNNEEKLQLINKVDEMYKAEQQFNDAVQSGDKLSEEIFKDKKNKLAKEIGIIKDGDKTSLNKESKLDFSDEKEMTEEQIKSKEALVANASKVFGKKQLVIGGSTFTIMDETNESDGTYTLSADQGKTKFKVKKEDTKTGKVISPEQDLEKLVENKVAQTKTVQGQQNKNKILEGVSKVRSLLQTKGIETKTVTNEEMKLAVARNQNPDFDSKTPVEQAAILRKINVRGAELSTENGNKTILINEDLMADNTAYHETMHTIGSLANLNESNWKSWYTELGKTEGFTTYTKMGKANSGNASMEEEAVVEFLADVAAGKVGMEIKGVREALVDMYKTVFGDSTIDLDKISDKQLMDFAKTISTAFKGDVKFSGTEQDKLGQHMVNTINEIKAQDYKVPVARVEGINEGVKPQNTTKRTGQQNADFFTGKAEKASSNIPYKPVLNVDQNTKIAKDYKKFTGDGNFTGHISKMIAGFAEKQMKVADAIVKSGAKSFLDIGASEGGLVKTVANNKKDIRAVAIDPNKAMLENYNKTKNIPNAEYRLEAFGASWVEDDGTVIKEFKPTEKFDVVNEDFTFQFINNDRASQVQAVKNVMNPSGLFITSEKFHTNNEAENEQKKYDHQSKYFNESQLTEDKQTIVSGMSDDMVNDVDYVNTLLDNFKYVNEFWNAGNFKGFLASDSKATIDKFINNIGDLSSEFTDAKSLTKGEITKKINKVKFQEVQPYTPEEKIKYKKMEEEFFQDIDSKAVKDGNNYILSHFSDNKREDLTPRPIQDNLNMSREEIAAVNSVGGMTMFYINPEQKERFVGNVQHEVEVPKERVYVFNSDANDLYPEAKRQFNEQYPNMAFSPNYQVAWMTKVANENGYDVTLAQWNGSWRAQTLKNLEQKNGKFQEMLGDQNVLDAIEGSGDRGINTQVKNAKVAEQMLKSGQDPETVKAATGYSVVNGELKSDFAKVQVNLHGANTSGKVSEIAPEISKMFPRAGELKVSVQIDPTLKASYATNKNGKVSVWAPNEAAAKQELVDEVRNVIQTQVAIPVNPKAGLNSREFPRKTTFKAQDVELVNGFYSPIEKQLTEMKAEKLPAKQWADKLTGEEAKWTGVNQWLSSMPPKESVTKAEILEFMKENRVEITEITKGGNVSEAEIDMLLNDEMGQDMTRDEAREYLRDDENNAQTKYEQYQLEGEKENYKEVLVTLPNTENYGGLLQSFKEKYNYKGNNPFELEKMLSESDKVKLEKSKKGNDQTAQFKSSHFDEPNILVHLRMNTRVDTEGKKVLFLEEIQSDAGQGKKKGDVDWDAPFITKTNDWTKLGLKIALKEAIAQGVDRISWATGEQQNDRYDLSKQVDWIDYGKNKNGTYWLTFPIEFRTPSELNPNELEQYVGKDVAQKIINGEGVESNFSGGKRLQGNDLKVGGKGMIGFYGSPAEGKLGIVGEVAKKVFGQTPRVTEINTAEKPNNEFSSNAVRDNLPNTEDVSKQYSVDIPQELKQTVETKGQAMFQEDLGDISGKVDELNRIKDEQAKVANFQGLQEIGKIAYTQGSEMSARDAVWDDNVKNSLPESGLANKYELEDILNNKDFAMLSGENPMTGQLSDRDNQEQNNKAYQWLVERRGGVYTPIPIFGKYGNSEVSFLVPNMSMEDALDFARVFNQESVATSKGLVYQDGSYNPIRRKQNKMEESDNYYSTIKVNGEKQGMQVAYDFNKVVYPTDLLHNTTASASINRTPDGYVFYRDANGQLTKEVTPNPVLVRPDRVYPMYEDPLDTKFDGSQPDADVVVDGDGNVVYSNIVNFQEVNADDIINNVVPVDLTTAEDDLVEKVYSQTEEGSPERAFVEDYIGGGVEEAQWLEFIKNGNFSPSTVEATNPTEQINYAKPIDEYTPPSQEEVINSNITENLDNIGVSDAIISSPNIEKASTIKFNEVYSRSEIPITTAEETIQKHGNKWMIINSDMTGVGTVTTPSGKVIDTRGGFQYVTYDQNKASNVGFAASSEGKIKFFQTKARELWGDAKGFVAIMVQRPDAMMGNNYALEYTIDGINQLFDKGWINDKQFNDQIYLAMSSTGMVNKSFKKIKGESKVAAKKRKDKLREELQRKADEVRKKNMNHFQLEEYIQGESFPTRMFINEWFLNNMNERDITETKAPSKAIIKVVEHIMKNGSEGADFMTNITHKDGTKVNQNAVVQYLMLNAGKDGRGYSKLDFFENFGDKKIFNAWKKAPMANNGKTRDWGHIVGGFTSDANNNPEAGAIHHQQFNKQFYGTNPVWFDKAYHLNEAVGMERNEKGAWPKVTAVGTVAISAYEGYEMKPETMAKQPNQIKLQQISSEDEVNIKRIADEHTDLPPDVVAKELSKASGLPYKDVLRIVLGEKKPDPKSQVTNQRKTTNEFSNVSDELRARESKPLRDYFVSSTELAQADANLIIEDIGIERARNLVIAPEPWLLPDVRVMLASGIIKIEDERAKASPDIDEQNTIYDSINEMREVLADDLTKAGQMINATKVLKLGTPESKVRQVNKLVQATAKKAGKVDNLTPEEEAEIKRLAKIQQRANEGLPKTKATQALTNYIAKVTHEHNVFGKRITSILESIWYANILSGASTHNRNIFANFTQWSGEMITALPKYALQGDLLTPLKMLGGSFTGAKKGLRAAVYTQLYGTRLDKNDKTEVLPMLEWYRYDAGNKFVNAIMNNSPWGPQILKHVGRLLSAGDALFYHMGVEMKASQMATKIARDNRRQKPKKADYITASQILHNDKESIAQAKKAAEAEGFKNSGKLKDRIEYNIRVSELLDQQRGTDIREGADNYASRMTFNYEPEGMLGGIYRPFVKFASDNKWAKLFVPFARVVTNVTNRYLDWTPQGYIRVLKGRTKVGPQEYREFTPDEKIDMVIKATIGLTATFALAAASAPDDNSSWLEITGGLTGQSNKDYQLESSGMRKYSIRFKGSDKWYSYVDTPLFFMLAGIGTINDAQRYGNEDEITFMRKVEMAASGMVGSMMDTSWMQGLGDLFKGIDPARMKQGDSEFATKLWDRAMSTVQSIAMANFVRQANRMWLEADDRAIKQADTWMEKMYRDVPYVQNSLKDIVSAFGLPVKPSNSEKILFPFHSAAEADPIAKLYTDNKVFMPTPQAFDIYDLTTHEAHETDKDELYDFAVFRGKLIRVLTNKYMGMIESADPEKKQLILKRIMSKTNSVAKATFNYPDGERESIQNDLLNGKTDIVNLEEE